MERDSDDLDPALHKIVRTYSLKVEQDAPEDTLSQALGTNARNELSESWSSWLLSQEQYSDRALLRLEKHKTQVAERWKVFSSKHPHLQVGDVFAEGKGPPRIDTLLRAAQDAEAVWQKKKESGIGKVKSAVESFMNTMSDHASLFSIIPTDTKYTSLVTGILTTITKAYVNHKKNAELFSDALEQIDNELVTVQSSVKISDTTQMRVLVVELYVTVFDFLCDVMEWFGGSSTRRALKSFRHGYEEEIARKTDRVKEVLSRIRLEASQATQVRVQDTHQDVRGLQRAVEVMSKKVETLGELLETAGTRDRESPASSTAGLEKLKEQFLLFLGQKAMRSLVATGEAQQALEDITSSSYRRISGSKDILNIIEDTTDNVSDTMTSYTRASIQESSAPFLKHFFNDGRSEIATTGRTMSMSSLPSDVARKVTKFVQDSSSSFLWVQGPVHSPSEQRLSIIAMLLCGLALSGDPPIPCVSFTPKSNYPSESDSDSTSRQERVLVAMLYSLAWQLIHLLPEELDARTSTLDKGFFERLDGSAASISVALDLIGVLLAYGPPTLIVIINKLQVAECSATTPYLKRFVQLLRGYDPARIIKALFITGGASPALAETMNYLTEKVDAKKMAQAKPGQPLRGWTSLSNLGSSSSQGE